MENMSLQANKINLAYLIPCDQDNKESDIFINKEIKDDSHGLKYGKYFTSGEQNGSCLSYSM